MGEGDEGDEGCCQGYDGNCRVRRCRRDDWLEDKRREGSRGGHRGGCCRRIEEECSDTSQEGRKPIHKGTMRVQSQASFQDRQGIANEEVQGDDQLGPFCSELVSLKLD